MPDDLRNTRRARLSGIRVTIEGATGERLQADVSDLSKDGLFIVSATPLAVGKRLSLEIHAIGEPAAWPALGRVVWTRESAEGTEKPAGMGVKIIDIEDEAATAIDRLLETRERTEPGLGDAEKVEPAREKTMLGVGVSSVPPATAAPILIPAPVREATLLGVGTAGTEAREGSLAIDLVAKKPPSERPAHVPEGAPESRREAVSEPSKPVRRSGGLRAFLLVLFAGCAIAAYAMRDRLLELWQEATTTEVSTAPAIPERRPADSPVAPSPPIPATTTSPTPTASAVADASLKPSPARGASPTAAASSTGPSATSSTPPSGASAKRPSAPQPSAQPPHKPKGAEDSNPY